MTDDETPDETPAEKSSTPPRADGDPAESRAGAGTAGAGRAFGWWLAAGALVLGLVIGGVVVGLASGGSSSTAERDGAAAPGASASPSEPTTGATGQISVNEACLRAVNESQDVYGAINEIADAARTLNATALDEIVRRLQPLQRRLQADLAECKVSTRLPDGSLSTGPVPSLTPSPTA